MANKAATLEEAQNLLLRLCMGPARKAAKQAMKEVRKSIVNEWFGTKSSSQMNDATLADAHVKIIDNQHLLVTVQSWVDPAVYMWRQDIIRWNEKHHVWGSSLQAIEYILDLQLERGIIGLPAKGTRPVPVSSRSLTTSGTLDNQGYWHNPHFISRSIGLRQTIEQSPKWTDGTFVNKFNTLFREGVK